MPIYEYRCDVCGEQFEKLFRSIASLSTNIECPACHSTQVQRLMSAPAIRSGNEASRPAQVTDASPASPPVFGRKELNQAQEKKRRQKEQVKYEKKQAQKKK